MDYCPCDDSPCGHPIFFDYHKFMMSPDVKNVV